MLAKILTPEKLSHMNSYVHFPERRKLLLEIENKTSQLLTLSDYIPLRVALATYGANYLNQVPLWMMIVAPPSSGKTEILASMYNLPFTEVLSDITKSSFLSGTSKKDTVEGATGGLLNMYKEFGFFINKDMTSLLSKSKDAASEIYGVLREIYDGDYSRHFGSDGGTKKEWHGRIGLIAAVTSEIEKFRSAISAMGDRFLTVRVYNTPDLRLEQANAALRNSGKEKRIREELQELTQTLFQDFMPNTSLDGFDFDYIHSFIITLTAFVACCRTPVGRSGSSRETEFVYPVEGYPRLAKQLFGLFKGCVFIGCSLSESWMITLRVGLDTIPEKRLNTLASIITHARESDSNVFTYDELRMKTRLSKSANKRIIEDLFSINVLECEYGTGRAPTEFWLSKNSRSMIESFTRIPEEPVCKPEIREDPITNYSHVEYRDYKECEEKDAS